jgi:hypothetical protein
LRATVARMTGHYQAQASARNGPDGLEDEKMQTFETKLGKTRAGDRTRIWIEGKRLTVAGFNPGTFFLRQWSAAGLTLTACTAAEFEKAERADRGTVSGKGDKPIIDVTGAKVAETFSGTHVLATYEPGKITVADIGRADHAARDTARPAAQAVAVAAL